MTDSTERLGKYAVREKERNFCNFQHNGIIVDKFQMQQRKKAMQKGNSASRWDHGTRNPPEALGFLYSMSSCAANESFRFGWAVSIYLGGNGVISVAYMIERTSS